MKKGWKIFWIVTGCVAGVGIIFCGIALALGLNFSDIEERYPHGFVLFGSEDRNWDHDIFHRHNYNDDDGKSYSGVNNLEITTAGCNVYLNRTDENEIHVNTQNVDFGNSGITLDVVQEGDKLVVQTLMNGNLWKKITGDSKYYGDVYIYLPENIKLTTANIEFGAGELSIEKLHADELTMNIGAAECNVLEYKTKKAVINLGAGSIDMSGEFTDSLNLKCGAGEAEFDLPGTKHDYNYTLKCGIGEISIEDEEYGGLAAARSVDNGGSKDIDIICGAGDVSVEFEY